MFEGFGRTRAFECLDFFININIFSISTAVSHSAKLYLLFGVSCVHLKLFPVEPNTSRK